MKPLNLKMRHFTWRIARFTVLFFALTVLFQNCAEVKFGSNPFQSKSKTIGTNPPDTKICAPLDLNTVAVSGPRTVKSGEAAPYQLEGWPTSTIQCPLNISSVVYNFGDGKSEIPTEVPYLVTHAWTPTTTPTDYPVTVTIHYMYDNKSDQLVLTFKVTVVSAPETCDVAGAGITGSTSANLIPIPTLKHTLTLPTCLYNNANFDPLQDIQWSLTGPGLSTGVTGAGWEFTNTYKAPGTFMLTAVVTDTMAGQLTYTHPIQIINNFILMPINGVCGKANGGSFDNGWSVLVAGMCENPDTITNVSGAGPWTWTCKGLYGGKDVSCSANKLNPPPPPVPPVTHYWVKTESKCLLSLFFEVGVECGGGAKTPCDSSSFFDLMSKRAPPPKNPTCTNVGAVCAAGPCKESFGGFSYTCSVYSCQ